MLVEFSVKNFRSIKDLQTISFVATNLKSSVNNKDVDENNICNFGDTKLLKTVGIYGPNASGKSNIIKALEYFCETIRELPSPESRLSKICQPFLYQSDYSNTESFFQIVLIIDGKKYRYGFTVKQNNKSNSDSNFSKQVITSEWLFGPKNKNQVKYFTRKGLEIDKSNLLGNENIAPLEYEHTLFLTHAASYIKDISAKIRQEIQRYFAIKLNERLDYYRFLSIHQIESPLLKNRFVSFLRAFGLHYNDIYFTDDDNQKLNDYPFDKLFLTKKSGYDDSEEIHLNMKKHESAGTKKLFDLAGLFLLAFNNKNKSTLIALDEIDSNFHPSLLIKLVKLFNDPEINKANAQLLFTSHDTNLMSPSIMRRDQFYFAEKDSSEATRFYSLADLRGIRNDADFAKHYLAGFYGSLPSLSSYTNEENYKKDGLLEY